MSRRPRTEAAAARPGDPEPTRPGIEPLAVNLNQLPGLIGVSRRTIERELSAGRFPQPDRRVGRRPLWRVATIEAWLAGGGGR